MDYTDIWKEIFHTNKFIDRKKLESHINRQQQIEKILPFSGSFFVIVNMHASRFEYIGQHVFSALGYNVDDFLGKSVEVFLNLIHPEDVGYIVNEFYKEASELIETHPISKRGDIIFQYSYRFKTKWNTYALILEQVNVLELDADGKLSIVLINVSVLEHIVHPKISGVIKILDKYGNYKTIYKKVFGRENLHEKLSMREYDVVSLLLKGNNSKQIAEELSISAQTVSTHRKNILKKLQLQSTNELISYAYQNLMV